MVIVVKQSAGGKQEIYENNRKLDKDEWEFLVGKEIKNIKKFDGLIIFTLK